MHMDLLLNILLYMKQACARNKKLIKSVIEICLRPFSNSNFASNFKAAAAHQSIKSPHRLKATAMRLQCLFQQKHMTLKG